MAKAIWMAGMLVGAGTAVSTVMPHDVAVRSVHECVATVMADIAACVSEPVIAPANMQIDKVPFSPDLPTATTPDAI